MIPSNQNLWTIQFKKASDSSQIDSGNVHVCCTPCVCDLKEFVKTDTLEVDTKDGKTTFDVLVIGKKNLNNYFRLYVCLSFYPFLS